jgi:hypothetical protein
VTALSLFDGQTFEQARDGARLSGQLTAVRAIMADGIWRSLPELRARTGYPEASISARLRDLRKPRFGGHTVERRRGGPGLFEYRLFDKR